MIIFSQDLVGFKYYVVICNNCLHSEIHLFVEN